MAKIYRTSLSLPEIRRGTALFALVGAFFAGFCGDAAVAQQVNAARLAPASVHSTPGESRPSFQAAPSEFQTPRNADKQFVVVREVVVEGRFPELREQTDALIAEIAGRRVSVAKLYEFANKLSQAYQSAGYPLARVNMRSLRYAGGVVRVAIIDGFIEDIDLSKTPAEAHDLIKERLQPLVGRRHLTLDEIQRQLLLVGRLPGLNTNMSNKPGAQPDGTLLIIQSDQKRVQGSVGGDNRLSKYYGTWEFTDSTTVNNALGLGEQFYGGVSSSRDFREFGDGVAKFQFYGGGVLLPLGTDGLNVSAGYSNVRIRPTLLPFTFNYPVQEIEHISGLFERVYARANYPLILTLRQELWVQAGYEHITQSNRLNPLPNEIINYVPIFDTARDRYDVARFHVDWGFFLPWDGAKAIVSPEFSRGLGGRFPDDPNIGGVPGTRPYAYPEFSKVSVFARVFQSLPEQFQLALYLRGQTSFGASLPQAEQLSLDATDIAVSGYAAGTLNADRGVTGRAELSRPLPVQDLGFGRAIATPYIFGASGRGVFEQNYNGELKVTQATSVGGGVRVDAGVTGTPFNESIAVECAKDFSNNWMHPEGYRTNLSFLVKF